MPDITVFGVPVTNRESQVPSPGSELPDATQTEIQQWEDDGGALPPDATRRPEVERPQVPMEKTE